MSQPTPHLLHRRALGDGPTTPHGGALAPFAPRTVPEYRAAVREMPRASHALPPLGTSPLRGLSQVERATVKVQALTLADVPLGNSFAHEAAFRLALAAEHRWLPYASGWGLAVYFETVFWGSHPSPTAQRGWDLLATVDSLDLAEVWLSGEPLDSASRTFRVIRINSRARELRGAVAS